MQTINCVCGGKGKIQESKHSKGFWHIGCPRCGHHQQGYDLDRVVKVWNKTCDDWKGKEISAFRVFVRIINDR